MKKPIKNSEKVCFLFSTVLYFAIILYLLPNKIYAQQNNYQFSHLSTNEGLSQNYIQSIYQDSRGFIWFATGDGLNRFDGKNIKIFRHKNADPQSISDNIVNCIIESSDSLLWIGTNKGFCEYNYNNEKFKKFTSNDIKVSNLAQDEIRFLFEDKKGSFWISSTNNGLFRFNNKKNQYTRYNFSNSKTSGKTYQICQTIYEDKQEQIWIGTSENGGLYKYNKTQNRFDLIELRLNNEPFTGSVFDIFEDSNGLLWIGTNIGLIKYNRLNNYSILYKNDIKNPNSIINNNINVIYQDNKKNIWIGTLGGLSKYWAEKDQFINYTHDANNNESLSNNNIQAILEDKSSVLWFGTATSGLSRIRNKDNVFNHFYHSASDEKSLSENTIRALFSDDAGDLWIGTLGGGINLKIKGEKSFYHIKNILGKPNSLSNDQVSAIYLDKEGKLWVGTWKDGLNVLANAKSNILKGNELNFTKYVNDPEDINSIADNTIQWIYEDSQNRIWIATGRGLDFYNKEKNVFKHFQKDSDSKDVISDNMVQSKGILEDKFGNIWVGTWNGLNRIVLKNNSNITQNVSFIFSDENDTNSISNNRIISLENDNEGNIWIGTYGGGINKLDAKYLNSNKFVFQNWNVNDGLPNNIIYGIISDQNGDLWLGTNNGLSRFNPKRETFKNYYKIHGLQNNQFFWGASCSGIDGSIYFGGVNGLNIFHPDSVNEIESNYNPPIYLTDFRKFGKSFQFDSSITTKKEFKLSYKDNFFSFVYTAIDFNEPDELKYAYILEGYDNEWRYVGNQTIASYTNLPGGDYIFKVKSTNSDGVWCDNITTVKVSIIPPFWATWWFRFLGASTIISLVFFYSGSRTKTINNRNKILDQKVKKRTEELSIEISERKKTEENLRSREEELNLLIASKDKFFSIISHDLRSPFTALLGITDLIISDFDNLNRDEILDYLSSIEKTSKGVFNLLENLLEWSRVQTGMMEFNPKISHLSSIVNEVINLVEVTAINKQIAVECDIDEKLYFFGDVNMIYTVLRNLTSNAIKFTRKNGKIIISALKKNKMIELQIEDNGVGMEKEILDKLFNIDVSYSTNGTAGEKGTGLGLLLCMELVEKNNGKIEVTSNLNEGTIFKIYLPTGLS